MTTNDPTTDSDADSTTGAAGGSTDQHITGSEETGTFLTDKAPTADTPANGSSNAGINATGANRPDDTTEDDGRRD